MLPLRVITASMHRNGASCPSSARRQPTDERAVSQRTRDLADLDGHAKRRLQFVLRQFADAIPPTNFAATNPEVISIANESRGESLAQGMNLLAADLARGRISMSDERAFEVGRNLAVTPGAVVSENEVMQRSSTRRPRSGSNAAVTVPPFHNKTTFDCSRNSLVRSCVSRASRPSSSPVANPPELVHLTLND